MPQIRWFVKSCLADHQKPAFKEVPPAGKYIFRRRRKKCDAITSLAVYRTNAGRDAWLFSSAPGAVATPSQDGLSDRRGDASRPGHFDNEQSSPGRGANPYPDLGSASQEAWGLVLDELRDPGNLGAILRIADWYRIPTLVCSPTTVDSVQSQGAAGQHGVFPARSGTLYALARLA